MGFRTIKPDLLILVEANPDEIIYRRMNDDTRSRDVEKASDIQLHQEMNRATSMAYATLTGATVKIVSNHDNHLNSSVSKLYSPILNCSKNFNPNIFLSHGEFLINK